MKVFTLYYDRFETATTSKILKESKIEHIILCHNNAHKFTEVYGEIVETNELKGIQNNLNAGLKMLELGEWGIFLSDDYKKSFSLDKSTNRFIECKFTEVYNRLLETIKVADKVGVKLVGLNCTGNAMFAAKKYGKYGLVDGRMFAIKKTDFTWRKDICTITDYYASLFHLKKYGGNLVLQNCYAEFERYGSDGIGTAQNREEQKKKDIHVLKNLYRGNVKVKDKPGQSKGTHIIIKR